MNRSDLVEYAKDNSCLVTEDQIERWHKQGLLPSPKRVNTKQISGSVYSYPPHTKHNLLLACTSEYQRSLEKMLLDVWIRGGDVDLSKLKKILLKGEFLKIVQFVQSVGTNLDQIGKKVRLVYSKLKSIFPVKENDLQSLVIMQTTIMNNKIKDPIWHSDGLENMTGEEPFGDMFFRLLDRDLFLIATDINTEDALDDLKENLNIKMLERIIREATKSDFERARKELPALELLIQALQKLSVYSEKITIGQKLFNKISVRSHQFRSLAIIALLRLYSGEREGKMHPKLHELQDDKIRILENHILFVNHLKSHPLLKKKSTGWLKFFEQCDDEERKSLLAHVNKHLEINPEFINQINLGNVSVGTIIPSR